MKHDHNGHFRLYRVDDHLRPWRLDDGKDNGWKANVRWVDVEPDIAITLGRDERMVWLEGHAAVNVSEFDCCCPNGYADIVPPYGTRKPSLGGENTENRSLDWLWSIEPTAKGGDLVAISGLHRDSGVMVLRLTERGRRWLKGELAYCSNFGSAFVHFAPSDEATLLLERARKDRLRVAKTDIALPSARQTDWDSIWQQQLSSMNHRVTG